MSPLTIYTSGGLPKVPQGPQGDPGPEGPKGVMGPQGGVGAGVPAGGTVGQLLTKTGASDYQTGWVARRGSWVAYGDNTGDGTTSSNTAFANTKSPVFTAPFDGWFSIRGTGCLVVDQNGATAAFGLLIGATANRMNQVTANAGWFTPILVANIMQLTAGQKVTVGYRPVVAGRTITLVNSNGVVPMLTIDEVAAPS